MANDSGGFDIPHKPDWNEAGYEFQCNFPKEAAYIVYMPQPRPLTKSRMPYRDLMAYVPQFQLYWIAMISHLNAVATFGGGGQPQRVNGTALAFDEGGHEVVIHAPWGDEVLEAEDNGFLSITVDYVLLAENPEIDLGAIPKNIYTN